jgi:HEAT repeat protein
LADPNPKAKRKIEESYLALLEDPDADIRSSAARACGKLGSTSAIPKLRQILASVPKSKFRGAADMSEQTDDEYRQAYPIAQALMELGDAESAKAILDRDVLSETWDSLLPRLGEKVVPLLEEKSKSDNPAVRSAAERTLAAARWNADKGEAAPSASVSGGTK